MCGNRDASSSDRASWIQIIRKGIDTRGDGLLEFLEKNPGAKIYMATTKAKKVYTEAAYEPDCYIMFGKESAGIPEEILVDHEDTCVRIPMMGQIRSLNLGNSVAVVLYEALRQNGFAKMELEGELHELEWHGNT